MSNIKNKNIILGVTGGIAAYKSIELLRILQKNDAFVKVVMTNNAKKFIGSVTFESLTKNKVLCDLFDDSEAYSINHIKWSDEADIVVVAPATANIIAKIAHGIADDALSTFLLACNCQIIICPSMNVKMYESQAVINNLNILKQRGFIICNPDSGHLACGTSGPGRLPEPKYIADRVMSCFSKKDLSGKKVLITAGPTLEHIDPVRFISNPSTGKMGYAIAKIAEYRGADVTLISGPTNILPPNNTNTIRIKTASEMADQVFKHFNNSDIVIKAAAVADYRIANPASQKIKKNSDDLVLTFTKNMDILKELGKKKKNQFLVGFAAETQKIEQYALKKLNEKNLDIIVANQIGFEKSGFGTDTNKVTLFFKNNNKEELPLMSKEEVSNILFDKILSCMQ